MSTASVLIVDDEALVRWSLKERLTRDGYAVTEAGTAAGAIEEASGGDVDLILLDFRLPDGDGLSVLRRVKELAPDTLVILMTAYSTVQNAVEAMKLGAYHYLNKPFNLDEVALTVEKALETSRLRREVRTLRSSQGRDYAFDAIIGASAAMAEVKTLLARIAASPASTVLLTGETGTGKDLAAKAVHYNSERAAKPFVNITASALPETLLESELLPVVLPPLRERGGDIRLLVNYYIDRYNREFRKKVRGASPEAMTLLEHYRCLGNIRELRNAIERAMLLQDRTWLEPDDFATLARPSAAAIQFRLPPNGVILEDVERELLVQALERTGGNQTHAGQLLGINRDQVRYRIEKFWLGRPHADRHGVPVAATPAHV